MAAVKRFCFVERYAVGMEGGGAVDLDGGRSLFVKVEWIFSV